MYLATTFFPRIRKKKSRCSRGRDTRVLPWSVIRHASAISRYYHGSTFLYNPCLWHRLQLLLIRSGVYNAQIWIRSTIFDHLTVLTSLFYLTIPFSYHTINQSQIHYKKHNLSNGVKYFFIYCIENVLLFSCTWCCTLVGWLADERWDCFGRE